MGYVDISYRPCSGLGVGHTNAANVTLPDVGAPLRAVMRPRGMPPIPTALSSAGNPVLMLAIRTGFTPCGWLLPPLMLDSGNSALQALLFLSTSHVLVYRIGTAN